MIGSTNFLLAPWGEDARRAGEGLLVGLLFNISNSRLEIKQMIA